MFPFEEKIAIIRRDLWKKSDCYHKPDFNIFKRHKYKTVFQAILITVIIKKNKMFKDMSGNIPSRNFLDGNYRGGIHQGGI